MAIRVGVIGAGSSGATHLASLATFPDVQIGTVCDRDRRLAEEAAAPFGASVHINFRNLVEEERLDAVFVCLPTFALGEPEQLAARAGIHVFVVPPVALNGQKARAVQKEIEKAGVISSVGHTWRYLSGTARLKKMLGERRLAMVAGWRSCEAPLDEWRRRRESSGGLFMQGATDLVDCARYVAGEVTTLCAVACEGVAGARTADRDIEDASAVVLGFRSGAIGQINCLDVRPCTDESVLVFHADGCKATLTPAALEIEEQGKLTREEHGEAGLKAAHAAFLEAVKSGRSGGVLSPYADAVKTLEVTLAVREAIESGRVVNL